MTRRSSRPRARAARTDGRARLLVIGGGERREPDGEILQHFVEMAGGASARILVCGAALDTPATTLDEYRRVFEAIGARDVSTVALQDRLAAQDAALHETLAAATAVFFTGGTQLRLASTLAGTGAAERIQERLVRGDLVVAGTSAGAAAMSGTMIVGGPSEPMVRRQDVDLAPGLGYWPDSVVDTHFSQRGRVARLLTVLAENPQVLGVGLDEDTAVDVRPGAEFQVLGSGAALVFDGRVTYTSAPDVRRDEMLSLFDARVQVLARGCSFDLRTRCARAADGTPVAATSGADAARGRARARRS